jgi:hypothetical protein
MLKKKMQCSKKILPLQEQTNVSLENTSPSSGTNDPKKASS